MNMNKKIFYFIILIILFFGFQVNAQEIACNHWHNDEKVCVTKSYKGKMCEYNGDLKGGSRCYQGDKLTDEVKEKYEEYEDCSIITDPEVCRESKIKGHECIWRQNACFDNTMVDDGTGETIIANDKEDRENQENKNDENKNNQDDVKNDSITDPTIVGENFCGETSTKRVLSLVGNILIIVKIVVPLLIIIIGSIDLFKAVMGKDEKDLMKSVKSLGLRLLLGIFIFFVPTIVNYVIDLVGEISGGSSNNQCVTCVLNPSKCEVNK